MKNFALIGAAGYIAPRHMRAIRETGNRLVAALDKHDAVGVLDSHFPETAFFTEFERFDRHVEKLRRQSDEARAHYVSICSPNYLHDSHIRFALRVNAHAICEKPLVLNPWNLDALKVMEAESKTAVYTIMQARLHPALQRLREKVRKEPPGKLHDVDLTYIASRGNWYQVSWKGDDAKSGGIATNIGIHLFDLLVWIFGAPTRVVVHALGGKTAGGYLELERARVRWFLSVDSATLPAPVAAEGKRTHRALIVDGENVDFSSGFEELHTASYKEILAGRGFTIEDARPSIELVHAIRTATLAGLTGDVHPLLKGQ